MLSTVKKTKKPAALRREVDNVPTFRVEFVLADYAVVFPCGFLLRQEIFGFNPVLVTSALFHPSSIRTDLALYK